LPAVADVRGIVHAVLMVAKVLRGCEGITVRCVRPRRGVKRALAIF
jgi:hypothetical protein